MLPQVLNEDKESEMKQWKCNNGPINCFARKQELHSCKLVKWLSSRCCPLDALGIESRTLDECQMREDYGQVIYQWFQHRAKIKDVQERAMIMDNREEFDMTINYF